MNAVAEADIPDTILRGNYMMWFMQSDTSIVTEANASRIIKQSINNWRKEQKKNPSSSTAAVTIPLAVNAGMYVDC